MLHLENAQIYPASHIRNFAFNNPQKVSIRGRVTSAPEVTQTFYHTPKTTFILRASELGVKQNWQKTEGLVKVTLYGERKIEYGDRLFLEGSLLRPLSLRNPGGFNYREYLANHDIFALLKVKEKDALRRISSQRDFVKNVFNLKEKLRGIIYQYLEPKEASLLSAILLGERSSLSEDIKDLFIHTGTIHILAISGLHIALIASIIVALFKLFRLGRRLTFILTILVLIAYASLSGARPSVVRATIMASVVLFGYLINREIEIYNSLGLSALIILIARPYYLFEAGFQLSFLSVISIVYFTPKIEGLFPVSNRCLFYLVRVASASLAAWIGLAPITAFYFNIVTPVAILANIALIPLLLPLVGAGISFLVFAFFSASLGSIFAGASWLSIIVLKGVAGLISRIPLGYFRCASPDIFFFFGYYLLVLIFFNYKRLRISKAKLAITFALAANILVWAPFFRQTSDKLRVTFLDVGKADAIFIEFPNSSNTILIDGGENDAGRWVILPFLWNKGIKKIDAVVLTHPDNDHVGGLASVLENIKVDCVFDNGMSKESSSYNNYKKLAEEKAPCYRLIKGGTEVSGLSGIKLFMLHPAHLSGDKDDTNNNSLVLKLVYKKVSFLFCADIQKQAIREILSYGPILKSSVIKVPHHGSDEGSIEEELFQAVSAKAAVISVDRNNRFGLPAPEVLERLKTQGAQVYKTAESGAITISTDGEDIWVRTMIGAEAP
ncbi:MAG: DNA internalization-related competence protein ComEC/Rec2 [Candidatus Omnitrophota bacterium]|nr:MAG: DNA internalization-related competence protein ComEC/Rec2 [Candidatus Omnitrophota bacterium]